MLLGVSSAQDSSPDKKWHKSDFFSFSVKKKKKNLAQDVGSADEPE